MDGGICVFVRDEIRRFCEWKNLTVIPGNAENDHIHIVLENSAKHEREQCRWFFERRRTMGAFLVYGLLREHSVSERSADGKICPVAAKERFFGKPLGRIVRTGNDDLKIGTFLGASFIFIQI